MESFTLLRSPFFPSSVAETLCCGLLLFGCDPKAPAKEPAAPPPVFVTPPSPSSRAVETPPLRYKSIAAGEPLEAGNVAFEGMVLGAKDGFTIRGAVVDGGAFRQAIRALRPKDVEPNDRDWPLGAKVRVKMELVRISVKSAENERGEVMQMRTGTWLSARRIEEIEWVRPAQVVEGTLAISKGFFSIGDHLVPRVRLRSFLRKKPEPGDRVRLYGQPRTHSCQPGAQCLIGGSLPIFDVARAEYLK